MKFKLTVIIAAALAVTAPAATVFNNADLSDSYLSTPGNWDNGLPSAANPGTISTNANCGNNTLTNFVVTQTAGTITFGGFPQTSIAFSGGSWTMNGGSIYCRAHKYSNGAVFTLNDGQLDALNNSDITVESASRLNVNGGTVNGTRSLVLVGGTFTMNGGTVDLAGILGARAYLGNGTMELNGGVINAARWNFQNNTIAIFGGTTAGSVTFEDWGTGNYTSTGDRQRDNEIAVDFLPGSLMTITMTAPRALDFTNDGTNNSVYATNQWAEALWETGRLTYDGQDYTTLGDWTTVTSAGFGDGARFNFDATGGGTLSLAGGAVDFFAITLDVPDSTLSFPTDTNYWYSIEFTAVLTNGFSEVTNVPGTGFTNTTPVDISSANGFYRVKKHSSP